MKKILLLLIFLLTAYQIFADSDTLNVTFKVSHPPNSTIPTITPSLAYPSDTLVGITNYSDMDDDFEKGSIYKWFKNGVEINSSEILNQEHNESNKTGYGIFGDGWYVGQSFIPSVTGPLTKASFYIAWHSAGGSTIVVELQFDNGNGKPNGTVLANSTISGWNNNAGVFYWKNVTFSSAVTLQNGTKYHLIIRTDANSNYRFGYSSLNYSRGDYISTTNSGTTWNKDTVKDGIFKTYISGVILTNDSFTIGDTIIFQYTPVDEYGNRGVTKNSSAITIQPVCGDSVCSSGESCSSCSADCGSCLSSGGGRKTTTATTSTVVLTEEKKPKPTPKKIVEEKKPKPEKIIEEELIEEILSPEDLYNIALDLYNNGEYEQAIDKLEEIINKGDNDFVDNAYFTLGKIYSNVNFKNRDSEKAINYFNTIIEKYPDSNLIDDSLKEIEKLRPKIPLKFGFLALFIIFVMALFIFYKIHLKTRIEGK